MYNNDAQRCLTGEVRLSYVSLDKPRQPQGGVGDAKYSATLLIPKTDTATIADFRSAIQAAAQIGAGTLWGGIIPPNLDSIIHDGDGVRPSGIPFGDECHDCWVITASTKNKPQVVGQDNINVELAPQDIYSGMYARVTVRFYPFNTAGKRGVGCGLGNVMKTRDGEPLSGGASAASDFAGIGNAVAPAAAPMQQGWPQANPMPTAAPAAPAYQQPYSAPAANPAPWNGATQMYASGGAVNPLTGNLM